MDTPLPQQDFLERNLPFIKTDQRFIGVASGGALALDEHDAMSDVSLILVVDHYHYPRVLMERREFASHLGNLIGAYCGEPFGDRGLLTCLYDHPLLHVTLAFRNLDELSNHQGDDPEILWERGHRLSRALLTKTQFQAALDPQAIEDRFWIRAHYLASVLVRGELFEAIDGLAFLRQRVLVPLARLIEGQPSRGLRMVEKDIPQYVPPIGRTIPKNHTREDVGEALLASIDLYLDLRDDLAHGVQRNRKAEKAVRSFIESVLVARV